MSEKTSSLFKNIFLTQDSSVSRAALKFTQYSDAISKMIAYESFVRDGMSEDKALNEADAMFINYSINENKYIKVLNDVGLVMFTKFWLQTPKQLIRQLSQHPLGAFKSMHFSDMGFDTVYDTYNKDFGTMVTARSMDMMQEATTNIVSPLKWGRLF